MPIAFTLDWPNDVMLFVAFSLFSTCCIYVHTFGCLKFGYYLYFRLNGYDTTKS